MKQKKHTPLRAFLTSLIAASILLGTADYCIDDSFSVRTTDPLPAYKIMHVVQSGTSAAASTGIPHRFDVRLFGFVPLKSVTVQRYGDVRLCPGGMPFGAKMFTEGLIVVGFTEVDCSEGSRQPALDAGICLKDILLEINGHPLTTAEQMSEIVSSGGGSIMEFKVRRGEQIITVKVTPSFSAAENQYKTGMWVRDNTAGIGTVTFIDPESGIFAGLGHGICDAQSGALLPLSRGMIVDVTITGIQKGASGMPGELKGYFSSGKRGTLVGNSSAGVFGVFSSYPEGVSKETAIPIALKNEIHDGAAQLYCTLDGGGICAYDVNIRKIKNSLDYKNLDITVTDPRLLEKTGGIVQGMGLRDIRDNTRNA